MQRQNVVSEYTSHTDLLDSQSHSHAVVFVRHISSCWSRFCTAKRNTVILFLNVAALLTLPSSLPLQNNPQV